MKSVASPSAGGLQLIRRGERPFDGLATAYPGAEHEIAVSFLVVDAAPGDGPSMHQHDYAEVIIVQEGQATCLAGGELIVANAGDVIFIGAGVPHRFHNSGAGNLKQIDIHLAKRFETRWLERRGESDGRTHAKGLCPTYGEQS